MTEKEFTQKVEELSAQFELSLILVFRRKNEAETFYPEFYFFDFRAD